MKQKMKKGILRRITAFFLAVSMVLGLGAPGSVTAYAAAENCITDNAFVDSANADSVKGSAKLTVGKKRHIYLRLDISSVELADEKKIAVLKLVRNKNSKNTNTIVITECENNLNTGDVPWKDDNLTYRNRPKDIDGSPVAQKESGNGDLEIDITEIIKNAKKAGRTTISLHLSTPNVDTEDGNTAVDYDSLTSSGRVPTLSIEDKVEEEDPGEEILNYVVDDAFVKSDDPERIFGPTDNLIIGKARETYVRLDLSKVDLDGLKRAVLTYTFKKGTTRETFTITQCSNYLNDGSNTIWEDSNIKYSNRPEELTNPVTVSQTIGSNLEVDLTAFLQNAVFEGDLKTVCLHIVKVETGQNATEFNSLESGNPPFLDIEAGETESSSPVEPVKTEDNYRDSGAISQKVFKIKGEDGKYLKLEDDNSGSFTTTGNGDEAAVFSMYVFDYTKDDDPNYTTTSYGIKCLDNQKYLTIQNYFGENDTNKAYYNDISNGMEIQAEADEVNWNERFYISRYETSGAYAIRTHLKSMRDTGFSTVPVRMGNRLYSSATNRNAYKFIFEDVADQDPLEVIQKAEGDKVTLSWYPVNGDADPANYDVEGAAVTAEGEKMKAVVSNLSDGENEILVSYKGSAPADQTVAVRKFTHPGIMHSQEELDAMKAHIEAKEEPWYSDYIKLKNMVPDNMSNADFNVVAYKKIGRGDPPSDGNIAAFEQSGNAAYFNALQWVLTGEEKYAKKAVEVLNAWSELTLINGRDRILGAAINSCRYINAAEILRYYNGGYSGYSDADFKKFQDMLINVIYPVIEDLGSPMIANGNWDTAGMISMISIGVLCDNTEIYNRAVSLYQDIHVNGSIAVYVSDWGQSVESARDQAHAQLGIGYMADLCMVDKHQGGELYKLYDNRLAKAFNWAAQYNLYNDEGKFEPLMNVFGDSTRGYWTSMDSEKINRGEFRPVYEVPLALYSGQEDMSWTQKAAEVMRAQGYVHNDKLNFGTLTTYAGEAGEEACEPYFQIRTRLEPWYQRTKSDVNKYGTPEEGTWETLNSYFTVTQTGEIAASSRKATAPYFQLITNEDGTYAVKCLATNTYLSVKDEKVDEANVIKADAEEIGPNEKFRLRCTGAAFYYLSSPAYDDRIVYVYTENTGNPQNAVLTMRLGTQITDSSAAISNNEKLIFIYNTEEEAKKNVTSELAGIQITRYPYRTMYKTGEELILDGLVVLAKGKNGISRILTKDQYTVSDCDPWTEGRQTIEILVEDPVTGQEHKASFKAEFDDNYIGRIQAEDYAEKEGNIYIREDKEPVPGTSGDLILDGADNGKFVDFSDPIADTSSYLNGMTGGDMATWKFHVPQSGFYKIVFRYNNPGTKWSGHRNARDERNCRVVVNNTGNYLEAKDNWVGWMIFNVSGYTDQEFDQSTVQSLTTVGGNTNWNNNYMNVYLDEGENELTLGIEAPPGQAVYDGPNLDCFDIIYIGDEYVEEDEIPYLDQDFEFTHPGVYYTMEDLENMKAKKDEEGSIYYEGYQQLSGSKFARKDYTPHPQTLLDIGPYNNPNKGGTQYTEDMMAVHHNALMWYFTGDKEHAAKAIEILNTWTESLETINQSNDIKLRIALMGVEMINGAEILKNIYNQDPTVTEEEKWQQKDIEAFETFLKEKIIPNASFYPQANGNWDALIGAFNMAAAVYLEDVDMFNMCLTQYYIGNYCKGYTASMGSLPNYIYPDGEAQETSRDQVHVEMGLTGLSHQCNIAWNQGLDLFEAYDSRLLTGVVYHARYNMGEDVESATFVSDKSRGASAAAFEILYQHYKHYGNISQEDLDVLERMVETVSRGDGKHIVNEVKENWEYYLAMMFSREGRESVVWEEGISLKQEPVKKIYTQGEELDLKGIEIILMTKNGTTTVLDPEDCEISGFDPNTSGEQTILIRYTNSDGKVFTTTFTVEVIEERFYTQKDRKSVV